MKKRVAVKRAKVLGKLPVLGRPTIWITVGQGPTALVVGASTSTKPPSTTLSVTSTNCAIETIQKKIVPLALK